MNTELCRTFYFAAKSGSISKAAEQLYITQPAVSRAIRQLEEDMHCTLFYRTPKGVKLTQEGEILFQHAQQAFNFFDAAEKRIRDVNSLLSGEIRIGASDTICKHFLVPYLKLYNTLHPGIKIHVICPTTYGIVELLKAGSIDFGLVNMPLTDDRLVFSDIMAVQDCFVVGDKLRHLSFKFQSLSDIVKHPLLLLERSSNSRAYIDAYFKSHDMAVEPAFELDNMDLLIQFARYDFGIACVIRNFIEDELDSGRLYEVHPIERIPPRAIGVAYHRDMPLSRASSALIDMLRYQEVTDI